MIWYLEDLPRVGQEREALETLVLNVDWLTPIGWRIDNSVRMIWDGDIRTPVGIRQISLRYPSHFPYSPPLVLPRGSSERWSEHQYGPGGELCLEYGPDNWHPDLTGADMIVSAYRLLHGERPALDQLAVVASRHKTTLGQDLRGQFSRLLITRNLVNALHNIPDATSVAAKAISMYHGNSYVHVIASITMPDGQEWLEELPRLETLGHERAIGLMRWPAGSPLPPTSSLTAFRVVADEHKLDLPNVSYVVLVCEESIRVYFMNRDEDRIFDVSSIPVQPFSPRLDNDHEALAKRKVTVVGCGSMGSKIAASLARSGVGKFLLVDDDILIPDNLVRHDLDWREVGTHKADSVGSRIQLVNPAAQCQVRKHRLGGQESSGSIETLIDSLTDSDLLIDATADPLVFNYLCAAVAIAKKPILWAEVFGGGFGGIIARHRPLLDPDPASIRRAVENWCADRGKPVEHPTNDYGGGRSSPEIADDADVTVIAAHASRMAIDMLIPRDPSIFPNSVYMVGLAKGWIFDQPFETYPIDVGPPIVEAEKILDPEKAAFELARIKQLFLELQNAASSDTTGVETSST